MTPAPENPRTRRQDDRRCRRRPPRVSAAGYLERIRTAGPRRVRAGYTRGWGSLVVHLLDSGSSEPSRKWETTLRQHLDAVGRAQFLDRALEWLALGPMPESPIDRQVPERDADYLKGFVWALGSFDNANVARALADMGAQCFRKVPNLGPISARVGNACVRTLGRLKGHEPVAQLGRLRTRVKYVVGLQLIEKALAAAAAREGIDPEKLEELAVPTFDLDASGALTREIGGHLAEIRITGSDSVVLSWKTSAARPQKSVPSIVRESHSAELARLKKTIKDITAILPAQRARLERLMESDRAIPLDDWRQRYIDHPVLGQMARRLIWRFDDGEQRALGALLPGITGAPLSRDGVESRVVDPIDRDIAWLSTSTTVRLWHPLGNTPDVVLEWRRWLDRHGVVQPFKQAHREIYILTDAERATRVYSNRFAAHVLRQHQFAALCRERGWQYRLQGDFDGANTPNRALPRWQLGVEFLVNAPTDRTAAVAGSGIYQYVFTDQVSFYRNGDASGTHFGPTRVPLDEVPALAFSEVMRDLDLFVGVCSIGNDPMWGDQGVPEYVDYWRTFSLNELSESAKMRRTVLEGLIPRLKIADRLKLEDPFLVVRGDLATYKIHLGSTNVLMEPGSRYLCIVPARSHFTASRSDVWLPFEGDGALAIIVSKALLLAADKTITDPVILAQLRRR